MLKPAGVRKLLVEYRQDRLQRSRTHAQISRSEETPEHRQERLQQLRTHALISIIMKINNNLQNLIP